jgi:hypothetical protein
MNIRTKENYRTPFQADDVYDMLTKELNLTKKSIDHQSNETQQVYYQAEAETESLKRIWKSKLDKIRKGNVADITAGDLKEFKILENSIFDEIARRKNIGDKYNKESSGIIDKKQKEIAETNSIYEIFISLLQEASKIISNKGWVQAKPKIDIDTKK